MHTLQKTFSTKVLVRFVVSFPNFKKMSKKCFETSDHFIIGHDFCVLYYLKVKKCLYEQQGKHTGSALQLIALKMYRVKNLDVL
jgi:hypothetical protein